MAQFARPDADTSLGGWTNTTWDKIDEVIASDVDKTVSPTAPSNATLVVRLSDVEDPLSSANHTFRFRYQKSAAGGATVNLYVRLLEGITQRAAWTYLDVANGWIDGVETLSGAEADAITNYNDLFLEFKANQV